MEKNKINPKIEILVIGGSAGSFEVLLQILPKIKFDIDFVVLVVLHRKHNSNTSIADLFGNKTSIPVYECEDKDSLVPGNIYFAPADYHLLIEKDRTVSLDYSEKENYSRPAIDITFKSASDVFKEKTLAVLLSGANRDGANGLKYISQNYGTTIVQDPNEAEISTMPNEALKIFEPNYILGFKEIIKLINSL
ncbi:chemotaxis protein CheB [Pedobacter psychrophilus]|uniref:protein-glutamate methylesterase n=1 Tax=Pedobacter psychrophilus TaxID=1826909 RepID=A0A179DJ08_9SPHI|nr:chemotaxis protein CheB [Pedobacter psychrophilus]OAQ40690.1 chemotaxis protein CheB [Pedobacter psychrophilus]